MREQIISGMAWRMYHDILYHINPESNGSARRWLENARKWARRHGFARLEAEITEYLEQMPAPVI